MGIGGRQEDGIQYMSSTKPVRPADRANRLKVQQTLKMARSAHAYVRGSTVKFYQWLDEQKRGALPEGPPVWICGDCHAGNLGPVAAVDGRVAVQIRDLDQTVIGNPTHDIIRLALSLATAARGSDLPGVTTAHILEQVIEGYQAALRRDVELIEDPPEAVTAAMKQSKGRSWKHLARERLKNIKPTIPLGSKFWPLASGEKTDVKELFETSALRHLAVSLRSRDNDADIEVLDAAYWMKGCSSLGKIRLAVLLGIGTGRKRDLALMDIKEAISAAAPRYTDQKMPKDNAQRVVEGANHLAPLLGKRMVAAKLGGHSVFVREVLPQDLKLEIESLTIDEAMRSANFLASVVGQAHGRQMGESTRKAWAESLEKHRTKSLDAPSWLWSSVVSLIGSHEVAYLEHCRRYANEVRPGVAAG
jgi:uncharacterized protein (DUF2252 family)